MAQFRGFVCDTCEGVIPSAERTKRTVRYEGPSIEGDFVQDLCPGCAEAIVNDEKTEMRPIQRRGKAEEEAPVQGLPPVGPHSGMVGVKSGGLSTERIN